MYKLYDYLTEMFFQTKDFFKHNYLNDVIDTLSHKDSIRLGKNGEEIYYIDKHIQSDLSKELDAVKNLEEFNNVCKKYGVPTWNKIFKGDFSGYGNGLASKNKGNIFEIQFIKNFSDYSDDLGKILNMDKSELASAYLEHAGGNNTRRPINVTKHSIQIGNGPKFVGDEVVDVKLITNKSNYNLSLKSGNKVTFCNIGIGKYIKNSSFNNYQENGMYYPGTEQGQLLLDLFGIDNNKFASTFTNYKGYDGGKKSKAVTENCDVTEYAKKPIFLNFIKNVIGYNYILVHQNKNDVHFYDLRTEKDLDNFIGQILSMIVYYPTDGNKKAVDIILETTTLKIIFNFRNKGGGIIPNQLMSDYIIK